MFSVTEANILSAKCKNWWYVYSLHMCFSVDDDNDDDEVEEGGEDGGNDEDVEMEEQEGEEEEEECDAEEGSERSSQDTTKYLVCTVYQHDHHVFIQKILEIIDREESSVFTLVSFGTGCSFPHCRSREL